MVKKQDNITLNMDLGKMTGKGKTFARVNRSSVNRKKDLFEEVYLEENKTLPKRDAVYNASAEVDNIPQFGDYTLKIPPFFAVPSKTGWRLANPLTAMRNLANRQKELSVNIKRANVPEPEIEMEEPEETPTLDDFSPKDQAKLVAYFEAVKQGKEKEYLFKNKPRGFPAVLYKNAKKAGLKQTKEKVYTKNVIKKGSKRMEVELQEDVEPVEEKPKESEVEKVERYIQQLTEIPPMELSSQLFNEIRTYIEYLRADNKKEFKESGITQSQYKKLKDNYTKVFDVRREEKNRLKEEKKRAKTTGGELPKGLNPLEIIPKGLQAVKDKVVDIAQKVIKGRDGYSPSVSAIIEKFADQEVKSIELHRRVLPTVYTGLLNVLTLGEFNKRIKDQPKDKLFHISMWVKLANGKTVLVEKNEVINMKVNPKKEKEEEVQPAGAVPAGLKFGEMLDKTQKQMGSKYFTYSARDNNCGNYIEAVLKANGMNTEATHAFIGQDAKAILKGYPRIAKALNLITDTAGRANVLMEGGGMEESDCGCGSESECECDDKEMNGEGLMSGRGFHVATMTNRFHRIPQSEAQMKSHLQGSSMEGTGTIFAGERLRRAARQTDERAARIIEQIRAREAAAEAERQRQLESGSAIRATTQEVMALPSAAAYPIVIASAVPEPPAKGKGLKKPKFAKGSQEAKDYMKMLRDKRGKK
jgi:hypothetical protein